MHRKVVVTGVGAISGFGSGVGALWDGLISGRTAFHPLDSLGIPGNSLKIGIGALVPDYDPMHYFSSDEILLLDRHTQFALIAAREAVSDAGLKTEDLANAGIVLGTGCGGKEEEKKDQQMSLF